MKKEFVQFLEENERRGGPRESNVRVETVLRVEGISGARIFPKQQPVEIMPGSRLDDFVS